ncbi:hypothetical protein PVAND_005270 [Polypedilum vanderplanki]|uniref:YqaJ viral recombinase domain-containing protein n=1 Tax=Polypedilum vanderplanki TaxID=319348 RepID=A0A9J6BZF7_POLVA|nr:hypothetical protein PVAND_005270 [Polypedilum vanderplanki]
MLCATKFLTLNNKTTKRRTRRSINQHKIEIKDIKDKEIFCYFNSKEIIVKINENEIVNVQCSQCDQFCEHQELIALYLSTQTKLESIYEKTGTKRRSDDDFFNDAKKQKTAENDENNSSNINVIKITKNKKTINLTEKQLKQIQEIEDVLRIDNLIRSFGRGSYEDFYKHCTKIMAENKKIIKLANKMTIEQADTDLWHQLRMGRVTASRLYETTRCTVKNGSLVDKFLGKKSGWSFMMMRGTVLEEFVFKEVQKEYPTLERCGLMMNHDKHPFFAASPDGLHEDFVLEIKCPGTANTFAQYTDLDKLNRKYFAQIQLQMFVTGKKKALLAVAALDFESTRNITKLWIDYDEEYVTEMISNASEFYKDAIFPALKRKFLLSKN